jgi:hypothetical protein
MPRAEDAPAAGAKPSRPRRPPGLNPFVPSSLDLEAVLRAVVTSAAEISGAALVTIWTANEDTQVLDRQAVSDERLAREYPFPTQPYGSGGAGWVALHRRPLNVRRVADDGRLMARDWCQARGLTSYLGLPIAFEGALLGVLSLLGRAILEGDRGGRGGARQRAAHVIAAEGTVVAPDEQTSVGGHEHDTGLRVIESHHHGRTIRARHAAIARGHPKPRRADLEDHQCPVAIHRRQAAGRTR